jgi:hypothetical protein
MFGKAGIILQQSRICPVPGQFLFQAVPCIIQLFADHTAGKDYGNQPTIQLYRLNVVAYPHPADTAVRFAAVSLQHIKGNFLLMHTRLFGNGIFCLRTVCAAVGLPEVRQFQ